MKIISKYKDYYDYLNSIYGIDEKIILDRRLFDNLTPKMIGHGKIIFNIAGNCFDAYIKDNIAYYGEMLKTFEYKERWYFFTKEKDYINIKIDNKLTKFNLGMYTDVKLNNENIISIIYNNTIYKYPQLDKFNFITCLSSEDIYNMIYSYISKQIESKENITNTLTDNQKLINKGFDKYSFKPKMK